MGRNRGGGAIRGLGTVGKGPYLVLFDAALVGNVPVVLLRQLVYHREEGALHALQNGARVRKRLLLHLLHNPTVAGLVCKGKQATCGQSVSCARGERAGGG
eukprot:789699-Pyramimonas_sp.AAC.1